MVTRRGAGVSDCNFGVGCVVGLVERGLGYGLGHEGGRGAGTLM